MIDKIVSFNCINKHYPAHIALRNVSFEISRGKVHGFLGPNGAGKSTTMKILAGLIPQTSGEILFNNDRLQNLEDKSRISYLPELPALYNGMKVDEYLSFIYEIYFKKQINHKFLADTIEICGLSTMANRLINHLSKGYKQKVGIAQVLITDPELIILDEPTVGLDPLAQSELRELIKSLKDKHTIFLSSHSLHDVHLVCDEISLINNGEIIKSGSLDDILSEYTNKNIIHFKCRNWNKRYSIKILENFQCEISEESGDNIMNLTCKFQQEIKEEVFLKFLIENNFSITHFLKIKPALEEVFFKMNDLNNSGKI